MASGDWVGLSQARIAAEATAWDEALRATLLRSQADFNARGILNSGPYVNHVLRQGAEDLAQRATLCWEFSREAIDATHRAHKKINEPRVSEFIQQEVSAQRKRVGAIVSQFIDTVARGLQNKSLLQLDRLDQDCTRLIERQRSIARTYIHQRDTASSDRRFENWKNLLLNNPIVAIITIIALIAAFMIAFGLDVTSLFSSEEGLQP